MNCLIKKEKPSKYERIALIAPGGAEERLDVLKKEIYYAAPRSEMVRDLIGLGIHSKLRDLNAGKKTWEVRTCGVNSKNREDYLWQFLKNLVKREIRADRRHTGKLNPRLRIV